MRALATAALATVREVTHAMADDKRPTRGWRRGVTRGPVSWRDEWQTERGAERTMRAFASLRADAAFASAEACAACGAKRQDEGDPEALCDEHLAAALGAEGGWP